MKTIFLLSLYDELCLPLRYTASILRDDGHQTHSLFFKGLDSTPHNDSSPRDERIYQSAASVVSATEWSLLRESLQQVQSDLIAVFYSAPQFGLAQFLTRKIQEAFSIPVVWAGWDAAFSPEEAITIADIVALGEPEYAIRHWVMVMNQEQRDTSLPGLWFRREGKIVRNAALQPEPDLHRLPLPDFDPAYQSVIVSNQRMQAAFPPFSRLRTNYILRVTRACPYVCPYCGTAHDGVAHESDGRVRIRPVDDVIEEIKFRLRTWPNPIERIEFHDEQFPTEETWIERFHERYSTEISLPFIVYSSPKPWNEKALALLKDAKLAAFILRIPSGSETIRKELFHCEESVEMVLSTARDVLHSGIRLLCEFLSGNPFETEDMRKDTLRLIGSLPKGFAMTQPAPFTFYENCDLYRRAAQQGLLDRIEKPEGSHGFQEKETPDRVFWDCLYLLAHFEGMEIETVLDFINDPFMRQEPSLLLEMVQNLYRCVYLDGNPLADKEAYIHELRWRLKKAETDAESAPVRQVKRLVELFRG